MELELFIVCFMTATARRFIYKLLVVFLLFVKTYGYVFSEVVVKKSISLEDNTKVFYPKEEEEDQDKKSVSEMIENDEKTTGELSEQREISEGDIAAKNWMDFSFGCVSDDDPIVIYVVPSCTHCAQFLATGFREFLEQYGQMHKVIVKFILSIPIDFFILKLFYNKFLNMQKQTASEETVCINMFWDYVDYMDFIVKNGINFKQAAKEHKFSQDDIERASPDVEGEFEKETLKMHTKHSEEVSEVNETRELETPYIIYKGKHIVKLEDALDH